MRSTRHYRSALLLTKNIGTALRVQQTAAVSIRVAQLQKTSSRSEAKGHYVVCPASETSGILRLFSSLGTSDARFWPRARATMQGCLKRQVLYDSYHTKTEKIDKPPYLPGVLGGPPESNDACFSNHSIAQPSEWRTMISTLTNTKQQATGARIGKQARS